MKVQNPHLSFNPKIYHTCPPSVWSHIFTPLISSFNDLHCYLHLSLATISIAGCISFRLFSFPQNKNQDLMKNLINNPVQVPSPP
ncbi:hypothetical protein L6452_24736 [Arctium lappa]|uniref:Uncharacterized protein n=1 Tax=Arctium lappa TaxID=4217 RepID=A0ACB9A9U9_ARCLA|nr:hypothetical protein L6452_24736 [Arctium lappa]